MINEFWIDCYSVGPQLLYPSPYVTPPGLMQMPSAGAPNVSPAAAAAAAAAAVASGFYDYPSAYATQFANGFDTTFPFGGAAAAAGNIFDFIKYLIDLNA